MTRFTRSDAVDLEANAEMAEALAPAIEEAPAAKIVAPPSVPAQFKLGAFPMACPKCNAPVWSAVTKSIRFGRKLVGGGIRMLFDDSGAAHSCGKEEP